MPNPWSVLWLQSGGCGGCSMALTCAEPPGLHARLAAFGIELLWHPSLSEASGSEVIALLEAIAAGERRLDCLCIEGALLRGPHGSGRFHVLGGTGVPTIDWVRRLAARAHCTVAVGSCAVSGGFSACAPNPTEACGLQFEDARRGGALGDPLGLGDLPGLAVPSVPPLPAGQRAASRAADGDAARPPPPPACTGRQGGGGA